MLKDVFLPWYHAYRMFVQCANAFEVKSAKPFKRDRSKALASKNTMDKWILAAVNSLVVFTRQEVRTHTAARARARSRHPTTTHTLSLVWSVCAPCAGVMTSLDDISRINRC